MRKQDQKNILEIFINILEKKTFILKRIIQRIFKIGKKFIFKKRPWIILILEIEIYKNINVLKLNYIMQPPYYQTLEDHGNCVWESIGPPYS